jgi:hypothetical protein
MEEYSRDVIKAIRLLQWINSEFHNLYQMIDILMIRNQITDLQYDMFISDTIRFNHLVFFYHQVYGNIFDLEMNQQIMRIFNRVDELNTISIILNSKIQINELH